MVLITKGIVIIGGVDWIAIMGYECFDNEGYFFFPLSFLTRTGAGNNEKKWDVVMTG